MREILFRGKRLDTGNWVVGDLWQVPSGGVLIVPPGYISGLEVDPATVGQFVGLLDKNGKRIFEGDIVKIENEGTYLCVWAQGNLEFALTNKKESFGLAYVPLCDVAVIGNFHDNPEALEVTPDE